jgi:hypothetical protein
MTQPENQTRNISFDRCELGYGTLHYRQKLIGGLLLDRIWDLNPTPVPVSCGNPFTQAVDQNHKESA